MTTPRIVGIDSWKQATRELLQAAAVRMKQPASFHGRYFHGPSNKAPEFNNVTDEPALAELQVRALPILRQTNNVGLGFDQGKADGALNAKDIVDAFGEEYLRDTCRHVRAFLDVEGEGVSHLSRDYYLGLCKGLDTYPGLFWPCIYAPVWDTRTWAALKAAVETGAPCYGSWLTAPYKGGWAKDHEPIPWTPSRLAQYPLHGLVHPWVWQYAFYGEFDANVVNPEDADASDFLRSLPLPQAA